MFELLRRLKIYKGKVLSCVLKFFKIIQAFILLKINFKSNLLFRYDTCFKILIIFSFIKHIYESFSQNSTLETIKNIKGKILTVLSNIF